MTAKFSFTLHGSDGLARLGSLHTRHGDIRTPAFMPVGTVGTVKGLYLDQVKETGTDVILGNTYHLMLRPGAEQVAELGGLHKLIGWDRPILTDSGGFQIMSLAKIRKITEQAAIFQSHIDGKRHELSPERAMDIQRLLGSDIQMQLDQCIEYPHTEKAAEKAMQLSLRWAERSRAAFGKQPGRGNFGIVQGGVNARLRRESAEGLKSIGFEGYAIGGLAVGEGQALMLDTIELTVPHLPMDRPRYLMGVGTPEDIVESAARGIDMFDCVLPTRSGRHGQAFTRFGKINLRNARHAADPRPLDPESPCPALSQYSRAYLHHLIRSGELLGMMLLSWANIAYYQALMQEIRGAIEAGRFEEFRRATKEQWKLGDVAP
ncbi:MAG: tRNA guanosine(34) transglycosylase Tgt [Rhizobiales bacterium]|nr:tRNA guanosine(34) transglycosylase Tgt [Hyphomicrobiales bacterium]MBI3672479.1 tRNA guanosine(34) transglycosylase Tgt [Hyphomicrobiales bacterium]